MSVIDFVDKMMIWDTGSGDKTADIVKKIYGKYPDKIDFKEVGEVNAESYTGMRQKMLDETKSDWLMILDGDEVWWRESIKKVVSVIKKRGNKLDTIVSRYYNVVGDIYHRQDEKAGRYQIGEKKGHVNIRFINRTIPGLYTAKPHGQHGYYDKTNTLIQEKTHKRRIYLKAPYMHFTNVLRSSSHETNNDVPKRKMKFKYEIGKPFPKDFYYPEVFFLPRPTIVTSPWHKMSTIFKIKSAFLTPAKKLRRHILKARSGY